MIRASSSLLSHLSQQSKHSRSLLSNPPHLLLNPSGFNTLADHDPIDGPRIRPTRRQEGRAVRQLTLSGNSAACSGRNNQGRITTFHRGGGSKRLKRKIDLKRSTSSMGIVERIEYDPNRSSRIALVRWIELNHHQKGSKPKTTVQEMPALSSPPPPPKIVLESTVRGPFSFSSMPAAGRKGVDQKKKKTGPMAAAVNGNVVVVGGSLVTPDGSKGPSRKLTSAKDVFLSALSKGRGEEVSSSSSFGFPRMVVAGARPGFFLPRMREGKLEEETTTFSLGEVRKWRAKTLTGSLRWPQRV